MLYNELEQGDILSGVRWWLALLAYTDILLCSIWAMRRIRQTPVLDIDLHRGIPVMGWETECRQFTTSLMPRPWNPI